MPLNGPYSLALGTGDDVIPYYKNSPAQTEIAIDNFRILLVPDQEDELAEYLWLTPEDGTYELYQTQVGEGR